MADWGGKGGSLYFTTPNADLPKGRFDKCQFDRQYT